jgi:tartrate dehydrogenase/decarboxylase/D-malate dehydrogenase
MKSFRLAIYPGDGIGTEVTEQAVRVLDKVQEFDKSFGLDLEWLPWGCDFAAKNGTVAPSDFLDVLRPFDAVLLGAVGDPRKMPDAVTLLPLISIRQSFDQFVCMRPAKTLAGVRSPLSTTKPIDMLIIRENSEGEYIPCGGRFMRGEARETAIQTAVHTRAGIERILRFGFEQARLRRKFLTMATKSNALAYAMTLWDEVLEQMAADYSDVRSEKMHVDAAAMNFVRRPEHFDVVVASNLFGDILSDLAGAIVGGLGLLPSANINPTRKTPSLFEPVHGSAPDIAGKGIANPVAAIQSAAMMLEWLGLAPAARRVQQAVERTLAEGAATADLGGKLTCAQMGDEVLARVAE